MICDDICTSKFGNFDKILKIDQLSNVRQLANQLMNSQLRLAQCHIIEKQKTRKAENQTVPHFNRTNLISPNLSSKMALVKT